MSVNHVHAPSTPSPTTHPPTPGMTPPPPAAPPQTNVLTPKQKLDADSWNEILTFLTTIPIIKYLILHIWSFGLRATQPCKLRGKPDSLLFNFSTKVPTWFSKEIHTQALRILKEHIVNSLEIAAQEAPLNFKSFTRLSYLKIDQQFDDTDDLIYQIEKMIDPMIPRTPLKTEPIDFHLGEDSSPKVLLSGLFIQAFTRALNKFHGSYHLHIHGSCNDQDQLSHLLKQQSTCLSLSLDLDAPNASHVFQSCTSILKNACQLQTLILKNNSDAITTVPHNYNWHDLQKAIKTHKTLKKLHFENFPIPPERTFGNKFMYPLNQETPSNWQNIQLKWHRFQAFLSFQSLFSYHPSSNRKAFCIKKV